MDIKPEEMSHCCGPEVAIVEAIIVSRSGINNRGTHSMAKEIVNALNKYWEDAMLPSLKKDSDK